MKTYRHKPTLVQAMTFEQVTYVIQSMWKKGERPNINGFNVDPIVFSGESTPRSFIVDTSEGVMTMNENDMLIIGVEGEVYPCKKSVFEKNYEEAQLEMELGV